MNRRRENDPRRAAAAAPAPRAGRAWLPPVVIAAVVVLAFANSFAVPFLFDDRGSILGNASLDGFWSALHPPVEWGLTVAGRPLLNLSFALNRWLGGEAAWGYHAGNVLIHLLAALALFGVVRRTLALPSLRERFAGGAPWFAAGVALVWAVHPLQTESVTYLVQRAESLVGLCVLFTLYAFLRSLDGGVRWAVAAVAVGWLGMAAKEVMAVAPVLVLLHDRTFVAGTFAEAWRRRWKLHLALAAGWVWLGWLVFGAGVRGGSAGFATGVTAWTYALKQAEAVLHYLRLAVWPHPLVLDYGTDVVASAGAVWPQLFVIAALVGATLWALVRAPVWGFLGAWFFAVLAPTSSVIPVVTQTMAEHRTYLALAPLAVLAVAALRRILPGALASAAVVVVIGALALATLGRNNDYRGELALWEQTAARAPRNARAQFNTGVLLAAAGRTAEAIERFREALALQPDYLEAHNNLGSALLKLGRADAALAHYEAALRVVPDSTKTLNNLAVALLALNRPAEAQAQAERALQFDPRYAEAHFNRGNALGRQGRLADAVAAFESALEFAPAHRRALINLTQALSGLGRGEEGLRRLDAARKSSPDAPELFVASGNLCFELGRVAEGIGHYESAVRLAPADAGTRFNLGQLYLQAGRKADAVACFRRVLEVNPEFAPARKILQQLGVPP